MIQERRDKLAIQIVASKAALDDKTLEKARKEVEKVFGEGMQVESQQVEKIDRNPSGKIRKAILHVPAKWNS